jgi:ABC-type nitrate/sulfonate/bicarbonate transport system substrate-binding protein
VTEESLPATPAPSRRRSRRQIIQWAVGGSVAALGVGYLGYSAIVSQKTPVRLGIAPGTQTLWRYMAQKQVELFGQTKYSLTFTNFADEDALRAAFANKEVDVIASLVPTVATLSESGIAAKLFLPMAWLHEGFPFVVPNGSTIADLTSLRGRKVATYPLTHPGMAYWHALALATAHLTLRDLNLVETLTPDLSLVQRLVEAGCLGGAQWAALQVKTGYHKLTDLQSTWSRFSGSSRLLLYGGFIARSEFLDANPEFVSAFVKAHQQAMTVYKNDRDSFLDATTAYDNPAMSKTDNQAQATYLGYDDVDTNRFIISDDDVADYRRLFDLMAQAGYLKSNPTDAAALFHRTSAS